MLGKPEVQRSCSISWVSHRFSDSHVVSSPVADRVEPEILLDISGGGVSLRRVDDRSGMGEPGRPKAALVLRSEFERAALLRWIEHPPEQRQALALRARIVLGCADRVLQPLRGRTLQGERTDGVQVASPLHRPGSRRLAGPAAPRRASIDWRCGDRCRDHRRSGWDRARWQAMDPARPGRGHRDERFVGRPHLADPRLGPASDQHLPALRGPGIRGNGSGRGGSLSQPSRGCRGTLRGRRLGASRPARGGPGGARNLGDRGEGRPR